MRATELPGLLPNKRSLAVPLPSPFHALINRLVPKSRGVVEIDIH